jgi:malonyl-CoA/methylmalonyl-CoA synthetase
VAEGEPGAIEIKSEGLFQEYWRKPEATRLAFTADGWFKTGDVGVCERGSYRILGRESVDILKSGGFKISALEVEEALREHPAIAECAVIGVADDVWGQRVAAAIVLNPGARLSLEELRAWSKQRIAPYKVPSLLQVLHELPRNPMGKVSKPELAARFAAPA